MLRAPLSLARRWQACAEALIRMTSGLGGSYDPAEKAQNVLL
jgi:hypothetical protein